MKTRNAVKGVVDPGSRHLKLLVAIESYGLSDTKHLSLLTGLSLKNIERPLRELYTSGLIRKVPNNLYNRDKLNAPQVYGKAHTGFELLERRGLVPLRAMWTMAGGQASHNLKVCLALASIEVAATKAGLRFIPWEEILQDAPEETKNLDHPFRIKTETFDLVPDAMFSLADKEDYRVFVPFELDLSDHGKKAYEVKAEHYRELKSRGIYKRQFDMEQPMAVATITTNRSRLEAMAQFAIKDPFYFKVMPQYGDFERAPAPALDILDGWHLPGKPAKLFNLQEVI